MKEKVSQVATVFSAFVMAGCCLGPLILIPLGLTGFAGAIAFYSLKYRLLFSIVTIVLLAYSFYMVYGRKGKRKSSVIGLWITTFLVLPCFFSYFQLKVDYKNGVYYVKVQIIRIMMLLSLMLVVSACSNEQEVQKLKYLRVK